MPSSSKGVGDIAKLCAGASIGIFALRYIWKKLTDDDRPHANGASPSRALAAAAKEEKATEAEGDVQIYFGSQSGTAQGFAEELAEEGKQHGITCSVIDMEDFDEDEFSRHGCVILMVATYGEGDPTDNAIEFFKWVQDASNGADTLKDAKFTVMGLGNRQYVNFNACARQADEHMERLGAQRIYSRGEGDDDQNIEEDFEQWKENGLWPALLQALGKENGDAAGEAAGGLETAEEVISKLPLKAVVGDAKSLPTDPLVQVGGADIIGKWYFHASLAPITRSDELLQQPNVERGYTTKHVDFDIKSFPAMDWRTADNLEVLAANTDDDVDWFAQRLGVAQDLEKTVTFVRAEGVDKVVRKPFPAPCTVRTALSLFCDLASAPGKMPAKRFASLTRDQRDRDTLDRLLQDREAWHWLSGEGNRLTLREFFELFLASAEIDFSAFVQICARQKNRPYTIASSSRENAKTIGICVSIVQEKLAALAELVQGLESRGHSAPGASSCLQRAGQAAESHRRFRGLCSTALCTRAAVGDKMWIAARASSFRLPRRNTTPVIMIGAGTGMAPFHAFLREFKAEGGVRKKTILFFGCRRKDEDFIYRDELEEAMSASPPYLTELITAFSRDPPSTPDKKIYVQDRLRERGQDMAKLLLEEGAHLFVCGSTAMGRVVNEVLSGALGSADQVARLQKEGRIVEELW